MLVAHVEIDRRAGHPHRVDVLRRMSEVEDQRADLGERERRGHASADGLVTLFGDRQPDVVQHVEDRRGAPLGELQCDTWTDVDGGLAAAPARHAREDGTNARCTPCSRLVYSHVYFVPMKDIPASAVASERVVTCFLPPVGEVQVIGTRAQPRLVAG